MLWNPKSWRIEKEQFNNTLEALRLTGKVTICALFHWDLQLKWTSILHRANTFKTSTFQLCTNFRELFHIAGKIFTVFRSSIKRVGHAFKTRCNLSPEFISQLLNVRPASSTHPPIPLSLFPIWVNTSTNKVNTFIDVFLEILLIFLKLVGNLCAALYWWDLCNSFSVDTKWMSIYYISLLIKQKNMNRNTGSEVLCT